MQNLLDQQQRLALQDKKLLDEYKSEINDKGRLRNERWGILSLRKFLMDQRNVSQIETKTYSFKRSY